jgi:hypothetical protein
MSQLAASEGQPRFSGGGAGLFLRRLETVKSQEECWQERYDGRLSRTDLWGRGGEIPLRNPTALIRVGSSEGVLFKLNGAPM